MTTETTTTPEVTITAEQLQAEIAEYEKGKLAFAGSPALVAGFQKEIDSRKQRIIEMRWAGVEAELSEFLAVLDFLPEGRVPDVVRILKAVSSMTAAQRVTVKNDGSHYTFDVYGDAAAKATRSATANGSAPASVSASKVPLGKWAEVCKTEGIEVNGDSAHRKVRTALPELHKAIHAENGDTTCSYGM